MRAVIVASGDVASGDERWLAGAALVIAADGGAATLERLGRRPDLLVGDLDSADPALLERQVAAGTTLERHPADKDASDTELALEAALRTGATEIVLLGATGGTRLDHEMANLLLLTDPALAAHEVRAVNGPTAVRALHAGGSLRLELAAGDLVTLLPVGGDVTGVTTQGLRWPLTDATLAMGRSRGLSNEVVTTPASVRLVSGTLLVIETIIEGRSE